MAVPTLGVGAGVVGLGIGTTTGNLWSGACGWVGGTGEGATVGLTEGNNLGSASLWAVAGGDGTSRGAEVRSPNKMRSRFKLAGLRAKDHQIIPPIALKATKIPIKSSKPKVVLSDDGGSGVGEEFVILSASSNKVI